MLQDTAGTTMDESQLYPAVKAFLEAQGFEVKGEVGACDVLALRGEDPPVAVELKTSLNLEVLLQAVDRTRIADTVYVAVPESGARSRLGSRGGRRRVLRLFRMLGIGLLTVGVRTPTGRLRGTPRIEVLLEPGPYQPRVDRKARQALIREFHARRGDRHPGGSRAGVRMTAYRQDALMCARYLAQHGDSAPVAVRRATGVERAGAVLYRNVYGWFLRPRSGCYALSDQGRAALETFSEVLAGLEPN